MPMCEHAEAIMTDQVEDLAVSSPSVPASTPLEQPTRTPADEVAELLRKAAYRVGQTGAWTQHYLGRLKDGTGTYARKMLRGEDIQSRCMLGALYCECELQPSINIHAAYDALVSAVGTGLIADWNDAAGRTQHEVVGALLRAAEIAEAA